MESFSLSRSFLVFLFLLAAAFGFLAISFYALEDHQNMSLAELTLGGNRDGGVNPGATELLRSAGASIESLDLSLILYSVVGLCVFVLLLRVIQVAISIATAKRSRRSTPPATANIFLSPELADPPMAPGRTLYSVNSSLPRIALADQPSSLTALPTDERRGLLRVIWDRLQFSCGTLTGRMMLTFTGVVAAFGVMTMALVYLTLRASLWEHAIERAKVTAVNISDTMPAYLLAKESNNLREVLRRHATKSGAAYVLVQDRAGRLLAHSFAVVPQEVQNLAPILVTREKSGRSFQLGKSMVHEISVPILEGQIGAVRVGIWQDGINAEIGETLAPMLQLIALAIITGVLLALYLAWKINRPIVKLISAAERISHGDLDLPSSGTDDWTELGDLSRALERLRCSVKAAMIRLGAE